MLEGWSDGVLFNSLPHDYSITPHLLRYGAVMNFWRERSSGYLGKKTSTL